MQFIVLIMMVVYIDNIKKNKMSWNHRVLVTEHIDADGKVETWYAIHEVYYDENGNPDGSTKRSVDISGNTKKDLAWTLKEMTKCLDKPFLWGDDRFPQEYKK